MGVKLCLPQEEYRLRECKNKVLRIFVPKKRVTGEWRKLHNMELHCLYSSNTIRVIRSRRIRWSEHVKNEKCI
jgi:hypothetical protein